MLRYVIKRILLIIPIMIASTILVFTLMYFCPGDPATMILGNEADPAAITALREKMGLNDPYIVRLGKTLWNYAHLDLGNSYMSGKAVAGELAMRIPNSLHLEHIQLSEAYYEEAKANPHLEIESEPEELPFDGEGNLW